MWREIEGQRVLTAPDGYEYAAPSAVPCAALPFPLLICTEARNRTSAEEAPTITSYLLMCMMHVVSMLFRHHFSPG